MRPLGPCSGLPGTVTERELTGRVPSSEEPHWPEGRAATRKEDERRSSKTSLVVSLVVSNAAAVGIATARSPASAGPSWTELFNGTSGGLGTGLAVQAATIAGALTMAWIVLTRRDPAA